MSCAFSLLESCHLPCSRYLSTTFRFSRGFYQMQRPIKHKTLCLCRNMQTFACELVKASYVPTPQTKPKDQSLAKVETIGAFQKLPMVMPSVDIFQSALRKAKRVLPTKGIANVAKRERNRGAKQLDALMKELAVPLRGYIENFPKRIYLHPYERSLIELTFGAGNYEESLSKKEAEERLTEGLEKLQEIFKCEGQAIDDLLYIAKTLRAMPVVDLEMPTLCLVGAPNVGKSSLVRLLSTGKPEVTDTPGLLKRCDEDRNNLEKLTLAVLSHLPTAILYVHDLSGQCGMSPSDQFMIYKEISERFGNHLWLDVISKCDLLKESPVVFITEDREVDHLELANYQKIGPEGALRVSVKNEDGIDKLKKKVHELLMSQMERIKSKRIQDNIEVLR
ncbi:hypothetical protein ES319_A09G178800v1 [Gossypium barbadense]|uniref:OBG-type G domain-containing protein n=1 Tax=Gossypium barbadense TaxID=3634 RepID=A0A5J5UGT5_GOSBA|nr:hypothetical protein ES319_A09G178800v1 [Gossypium barbadense]